VRLWKWASVSIGSPLLRNIKGRSFPRAFERREKFLYSRKFFEEFERYLKKGPVKGQLSP
jgi:hypothetical protein